MPAIPLPLADLTANEFKVFLLLEWPEDESLEYKRTLPAPDGHTEDRWISKGDRVGDRAKRELLIEVVAFANTYGGDLILGVDELRGDGQRRKPVDICPVPRCVALAESLAMMARDLIEPQIPRLDVRGIPTEGDAGIVIFRVPRSRMAPHRLTITKECYRRVRDRTEPMSMREIQDLTFAVARGLERVDARLASLRQRYDNLMQFEHSRMLVRRRVSFCVRAVPETAELAVERVHRVAALTPIRKSWNVTFDQKDTYECHAPDEVADWRPILRGTQAKQEGDGRLHAVELFSDGAVIYQYGFDSTEGGTYPAVLYPGWLFATIANACATVDQFRAHVGASAVDYGLEVELNAIGVPHTVMLWGKTWHQPGGHLNSDVLLPRYVLGGNDEERLRLLNLINRDFWSEFGRDAHDTTITDIQPR